MQKQEKVLIVILNYKTYNLTLELIKDLRTKIDYKNYSIFVIDNCSPNESASVLKKNSIELDYIFFANNINSGYAAGNNIGIRYAIANGFEYSWILNNDVKITDDSILKKMVKIMGHDQNIACVGPEIIDIDGFKTAPYIDRPNFTSLTFGIVHARNRRREYIGKSLYVYRIFGCCMLLRNSSMQEVDCMDERTFLYCEEEILAEKLIKISKKIYYTSETNIIHLESMTVNGENGKRSIWKTKILLSSMNLYLKEYLRFGVVSRGVCLLFKAAVILLRG